ncbi:hypothetical protein GCM10009530_55560 [Microbispora corallina]|uniref:DUF1440 domain-containing protein n=1 Tax=Microbispora corallina TaxID=83302 RepID=A0ABQ4G6Y5_9ACTN|nr:hypothetical protein [Microbispora corallina]GIH42841.1 hypothetical protein Mco01_58410 [Microbispora corallina]
MGKGRIFHDLAAGVAAGATGTTALNAITYLDMAVRGRPASGLPEKTVDTLTERLHVGLGPEEDARNREQGLGPMLGILTGVGVGLAYGLFRHSVRRVNGPAAAAGVGLAAAVASNLPMTSLGLTDPRKWGIGGWVSDLIPHLGYGAATVAAFELMRG